MAKKIENDQKIERRTVLSFVITTAVTALVAVIVLVALIVTSQLYTNALKYYGFAQGDIGKAMTYFSEIRSSTRAVIGYQDPEVVAKSLASHDENKAAFEKAMVEVENGIITDEAREQYNSVQQELGTYWEIDSEIIEKGQSTDTASKAEAQSIAVNQLMPKFNEINKTLTSMLDIKVDAGDERDNLLTIVTWVITVISVVLIIGVVLLSIKMGRSLARQVADSLQKVADRMRKFAEGDLSSDFPEFEIKDEINELAITAKEMAENIKIVLNDVDNNVASIADGDFTTETSCPERYVGEFASLKTSIEGLVLRLRETLLQIGEASQQVDAGSGQLAESATALAEGATEQAGAVEELTATIEDITSKSEITAKRIEEAYQKGLFYREKAENGKQEVSNLVNAMECISQVSKEIENIIAEIEDIASQTNLLSLNASIEAARAGEAGKGFAVVADQIGKLATDSAQSAVRTRELIQNSLDEVEKGNAMTERTKEALQEVVQGIEFLSNASKDASEVCTTQVSTMHEVEKGIEQISGVIQSNSASAEETSATGEELAAQATTLKELIGQFVLQ